MFIPLTLNKAGMGIGGTVVWWGRDEGGLWARDDTETAGFGYRLSAVAGIEFLVDVLQVCFDRLIGNE